MNTKFERKYLKYIVKSPILFWAYMGIFLIFFLLMTTHLKLEVRNAYDAEIVGGEISILTESEIEFLDRKIYTYKDKNQKVTLFKVASSEYKEGVMYIYLCEDQTQLSGEIVVELISGKVSLFNSILLKAGTRR